MSRKKIVQEPPIKEKPFLPSVEVKRLGRLRFSITLTTAPEYLYRNWRGLTEYRPTWEYVGTRAGAERSAKRILRRYLRRTSYLREDRTLYVAKEF